MALSEYEKKVLKDMESHLREDDPELASTFSAAESSISQGSTLGSSGSDSAIQSLSLRRIAGGVALVLCGLGVILLAMAFGHGWLTVVCAAIGFAVMLGGVLLALSGPSSFKKKETPGPFGDTRTSTHKPSADGWTRFRNNQQKRWDERSDS